jgi:two-component system, sensor histidine kinase and response regulator
MASIYKPAINESIDPRPRDGLALEDGGRRVRAGCLILASAQLLYLPNGLRTTSFSDTHLWLTIVNFIVTIVIGAAMFHRPTSRYWRVAAWIGCSALIATGTVSSISEHVIDTHLLTLVIFSLGTSVMLPWETLWQGLLNASCLVSFIAVDFSVASHDIYGGHRWAILLGTIATSQASTFFSARYRQRIGEAAARTDSILESALDAFVAINEYGVVEEWNARSCDMFGYSAEEARGRLLADLIVPPESRRAFTEGLRRYKETGQGPVVGKTVEVAGQRRDGSTLPIELAVAPVAAKGGWRFNAFIRDISERRRAEDLRLRLATIVESSEDAIIGLSTEGKIASWNQAAERLFGYKSDEISGRPSLVLVPPEDHAQLLKLRQVTAGGGSLREIDGDAVRKDGARVAISFSAAPIKGPSGATTGFSVVCRDVSMRREYQAGLAKARDEALETARLRSVFLANMSHEIRTPLNGVLGMAELLLESPLKPEQRELAETIQASGDTLLAIVDDILDFSKIAAGKMVCERIPFDLHATIEVAADLLADRAAAKNIEIIVALDAGLPQTAIGDPVRLRQVLVNLIGNAVKFTEVGEVIVSAKLEGQTEAESIVRFEVVDSGIGIAPDSRARLFQPFSQADSSTTRKYGGTGLGLVISARIVEMMGGEIGVESEPGKGSSFFFTARLSRSELSQDLAPHARAELSPKRILIVDDNAVNGRMLRERLRPLVASADWVATGVECLKALRSRAATEPFDVALIDLRMPGVDGLAAAAAIRADPAIASTRLILMGSRTRRSELGSLDAIVDGWLTKPVLGSRLLDSLLDNSSRTGDEGPRDSASKLARGSGGDAARRLRDRILIVDDNRVNQTVTLRQLEELGYAADIASNGREAVEAFDRRHYSLILMDCQMPEMDGYEATAAIRLRKAGVPRVVIVALTAHALEGERGKCLAAGMDDCLTKPLKLEDLSRVVEHWLAPSL